MPPVIDNLAELLIARRLMIATRQLTARHNDPHTRVQSARDAMEEDQALLSPEAKAVKDKSCQSIPDDTRINLSELNQKLSQMRQGEGRNQTTSAETLEITYEKREVELEITYRVLTPVQGLVRHNAKTAETDRYEFIFQDGTTFKIVDKWSGKSTTIWGDPHVDTSDQEGESNGEFSDLKGSDMHTTLMLEDGTRVTFTARDNGIIEEVDIFKGSQHLRGIGAASQEWGEENMLFSREVDGDSGNYTSRVSTGDIVYAGGDGNDWYDQLGHLVWGETTGAKITTRPDAVYTYNMRETVEQVSFTSVTINHTA